MTDTGRTLHSLAMPSCGAATGTPTTMRGCSTSTTIGPTTTTTTLASADPSLQHLDVGNAATEGSILVEGIPQDPAKARQHAKPKTTTVPMGAVVGRGKRISQDSDGILYANPSPELMQKRFKRGVYIMEPDGLYKRCSRCKEYWPADSEFFYSSRCEKDGLIEWCKACYLENRYPNGRPTKKNGLLDTKQVETVNVVEDEEYV